MKYKDYYAILGVERGAADGDIRKAYRKLARKYHPDVSKEPNAEERFKEIGEAYETLKDAEKRAAYDQLGRHRPGEDFRPPPGWDHQFGGSGFEDVVDLSDLFAQFGGGARAAGGSRGGARGFAMPGQDYEVTAHVSLEDAARGTELAVDLSAPERGPDGMLRRVPKTIRVRVPKGATDGQRMRVPGKGGPGVGSGPAGDLYINIHLLPHPLFKVAGHDLYLDLPVTPSEAVLGADVEVPTLAGRVRVQVRPSSRAGQKLRLAGKGLPKPGGGPGDLYCVLQVVTPAALSERERSLYEELAKLSTFNPRGHFG
ncbi:MAG: DnaJ domain-containing protein [Burkholderiales bacterium]|nr:DnaJ domain-containing protein [Burkholderiales bacterium]